MRLRKTITVAFVFASLALGCGPPPGQPENEPKPAPPETVTENQPHPPRLTVIPASVAASRTDDPSHAYQVLVDQALLFDPRTGPINASLDDEPGIHLLVAGRIYNNSNRLLHRAKVYATVAASFPEQTVTERHSGGLGFEPTIDSEHPWQPQTYIVFRCITRALDPIYLEYLPDRIAALLTLTARDPLSYFFQDRIDEFEVEWLPVLGVIAGGEATAAGDGQAYCAPQAAECLISQGQKLQILYQRGAGYKVVDETGRPRWLKYDQLVFSDTSNPAPPLKVGFPIAVHLKEGLTISVMQVLQTIVPENLELESENNQVFRVDLEMVNTADRYTYTPSPDAFALDLSAGAYAQPLKGKNGADSGYRKSILMSGEKMMVSLYFAPTGGNRTFPFELELYSNGDPPTRWPLFPTLTAASGDVK